MPEVIKINKFVKKKMTFSNKNSGNKKLENWKRKQVNKNGDALLKTDQSCVRRRKKTNVLFLVWEYLLIF